MSKIEIELCGCCEKVLSDKDKNGLAVTIKYSDGGWGRSKTLFDNNNDEVCGECYEALMDYLNSFVNHWENLRGENRPKEIKL